jgi:hypothetical protein
MVDSWGTGRPDYTGEQHYIRRAETVKYLNLDDNEQKREQLLVFSEVTSAFSWVASPLAPGSSAHLIDGLTGVALPYTVPAGYGMKIIRLWASADQPVYAEQYLDIVPGETYFEQEICEASTADFDPTFSSSHIWDLIIYNAGDEYLHGTVIITVVLSDWQSEAYEQHTKIVRCKSCGEQSTVSVDTAIFTCSTGHKTIVKVGKWGGK